MMILKKDLYLIFTKYSFQIVFYFLILLVTRDISGNTIPSVDTFHVYSGISLITPLQSFSIGNIIFIYIFLGSRIPTKLFESEEPVKSYLFSTPTNNNKFLWSKIIATLLIMIPFLVLSLFMLNSFSLGTFVITFLVAIILVNLIAITTFIKNKVVHTVLNLILTIGILIIAFSNNPLSNGLNKILTENLNSGVFPIKLALILLLMSVIAAISATEIHKMNIKKRRANG